ncbi:MAG: hypothetical protein ACYC0H_09825, partial [Solirubrobacteraceae bacterium]
MELLLGGQLGREAEEARLANPEAVQERERSRTAYSAISGKQAVALGERVFEIQRPQWRTPVGRAGAKLSHYVGEDAAAEVLPSGGHVLVESSTPLVSSVGTGKVEPVSLALEEAGGSYKPANPVVPVTISKQASGGISLPYGISVAPAQAAEPEASAIIGHKVVYPGTATDTSFMAEPLPGGAEVSWQLASAASPEQNALRFSLPAGASLRITEAGSGGAEVLSEGQALLRIAPAIAVEADGVSLPVTYAVENGDTLVTRVSLSGSVAFPVLIDPQLEPQDYRLTGGTYGGWPNAGGDWAGWSYNDSPCGCFRAETAPTLLRTALNGEYPNNEWGEWFIYAPGDGGASITRAEVMGLYHGNAGQSTMQLWLVESNGSKPVWTFDGYAGAEGEGPLITDEAYGDVPAALCAQGAGGKDGGEQPLCNENYGAKGFAFADVLGPNGRSGISENYVSIAGAALTYLQTASPEVTVEGLSRKWVKYGPEIAIHAKETGTGIQALTVEIPPGYAPEKKPYFATEWSCSEARGFDGCPLERTQSVNLSGLPSGAHKLGIRAYDAAGVVREYAVGEEGKGEAPGVYIDHNAPTIKLAGPLVEAEQHKIGPGNYALSIEANTELPGAGLLSGDGVEKISVSV